MYVTRIWKFNKIVFHCLVKFIVFNTLPPPPSHTHTVMRLTKPSLMSTVPVLGEPWDMLGKAL